MTHLLKLVLLEVFQVKDKVRDLAGKAFLVLISILLALAVAETAARVLIGKNKTDRRSFEPYFASGDVVFARSRSELVKAKGGPESYGYTKSVGVYFHTPNTPATVFDRSNFLFEHSHSRYDSHQVDEIARSKPDSIRIFVVGGSAAQGLGASGKDTTWHAILEGKLREALNYKDIYVFNAAMGSFVTTQERIGYDVAVAPRNPDLTLILNGFNDLYLPVIFGTRPGDPYQTGLRYYQILNPSTGSWLEERSYLFHYFYYRLVYKKLTDNTNQTLSDTATAATLSEGIGNVYNENVQYLINRGAKDSPVLVFLQPWRDLARVANSHRPRSRHYGFYQNTSNRFRDRFKKETRFVDISSSLSSAEGEMCFVDYVHFNDTGHKIVADVIFPHVLREAERIYSKKTTSSSR